MSGWPIGLRLGSPSHRTTGWPQVKEPAVYASVHQFHRSLPHEIDGWAEVLAATLHEGQQPVATCTLAQLAGLSGAVVTFWTSREEAESAADRRVSGPVTWQDSGCYEVVAMQDGVAAGQSPSYAQLTWFDGPRSPAQVAADDRAGRERIWSAVRDVAGSVGAWILRADGLGMVAIGLATNVETFEAIQQAIMATELLPGEDPALLNGPDRVDIHRVLFAELPVLVGKSS